MHLPAHALLRQLNEETKGRALDVFTAALVRADALELADALGDALVAAEKAAVEPVAAVAAAKQALDKEENSVLVAVADFFKRKVAGTVKPGEPEPDRSSPKVRALREALAAAEQEAAPFTKRVRYHTDQIAALRAAPAPDPAVLAVLAESLCGCHVDAPVNSGSMATTQAAQSAALEGGHHDPD
jgi:hypothetical protein